MKKKRQEKSHAIKEIMQSLWPVTITIGGLLGAYIFIVQPMKDAAMTQRYVFFALAMLILHTLLRTVLSFSHKKVNQHEVVGVLGELEKVRGGDFTPQFTADHPTKTVVSELSDPLVHLIRNSLDHGIELPEVRQAQGKDPKGTIRLTAFQEGDQVIITIEDDGKGLNPKALKESADRKGIDTTNLTDEELQRLIFRPGFSTAAEVTNISGRGVGMDAVQAKITSLGGTIELKSQVDVGTTFTIRLPLTLSIIDALMVQVTDDSFAIPLDVVERVVLMREEEIVQTLNQEVYSFQGGMIPVIRTNKMLAINEEVMDRYYGIIVNIDQKYYSILADRLIGQQEVVIKKIDGMLQQTRKYQGATILGDGSIALILDVNAICTDQRSA